MRARLGHVYRVKARANFKIKVMKVFISTSGKTSSKPFFISFFLSYHLYHLLGLTAPSVPFLQLELTLVYAPASG